jgi:hypothetical protein
MVECAGWNLGSGAAQLVGAIAPSGAVKKRYPCDEAILCLPRTDLPGWNVSLQERWFRHRVPSCPRPSVERLINPVHGAQWSAKDSFSAQQDKL